MRRLFLLIVATTALSSGCANHIARAGMDLTSLETKEEFRARLGEPARVVQKEDGTICEEYRTRRKIAEPYTFRCFGPGYAMVLFMTCGTAEILFVSQELWLVGRRTLLGQTVGVSYDGAGKITGLDLDGDSLYFMGRRPAPRPSSADVPVADTTEPRLGSHLAPFNIFEVEPVAKAP